MNSLCSAWATERESMSKTSIVERAEQPFVALYTPGVLLYLWPGSLSLPQRAPPGACVKSVRFTQHYVDWKWIGDTPPPYFSTSTTKAYRLNVNSIIFFFLNSILFMK